MKLKNLDHIVLTTKDLDACLHFYRDILGMEAVNNNGRWALTFGDQKINIHTKPGEFQPAAAHPEYGSLDLCLIVEGPIESVKRKVEEKGWEILEGIVPRNGARGAMKSIYLRDPDGNLVELAVYEEEEQRAPKDRMEEKLSDRQIYRTENGAFCMTQEEYALYLEEKQARKDREERRRNS